jgi:hypothetical protein
MFGGRFFYDAVDEKWRWDEGSQLYACSQIVQAVTGASSISRALLTRRRLASFSFSGGLWGQPSGWLMATPWRIRLAPMVAATVGKAVTITAGIPSLSISLANVAPQRVPVPHVPTSRAASTPLFFRSQAISAPMRAALARVVELPVVT